jgi:hypothetical protein
LCGIGTGETICSIVASADICVVLEQGKIFVVVASADILCGIGTGELFVVVASADSLCGTGTGKAICSRSRVQIFCMVLEQGKIFLV